MIYSKITFFIFIIIFILLARGTWNIYSKASRAKHNEEAAKKQLVQLKKREAFLRAEIERIKTKRGQEDQLRKQFDVGRDGEKMVVFVNKEVPAPKQQEKPKTFLDKVYDFFGL